MSITVTVTDMSCDGCEEIVEGAVADVAGVESVEADRDAETVTVEGDADVEAVMEAIDFAGYTPSRGDDGDSTGDDEAADEEDDA
jgi:copper chaperone CopZ